MTFRAFDLTRWTLAGLRRLLYLGIRTQVFPDPDAQQALRPDVAVCYVLQYRHLTNLLFLFFLSFRFS